MKHVENNCEDACMDNEPNELFKDECDHSGKKTCIEVRVLFEKSSL